MLICGQRDTLHVSRYIYVLSAYGAFGRCDVREDKVQGFAVNKRKGSGSHDGTVIQGNETTLSCGEPVSYRVSSDEELSKLIQCHAIWRPLL